MKTLLFILLLNLFIPTTSYAATTEAKEPLPVDAAAKKVIDYFYVDKKPLPPRCLWAMSLDTAELRMGVSTILSDCMDVPEQLEQFGPLIERGDGMIGNFVTFGGSSGLSHGHIFYKNIGMRRKKNVLLVKTTTDNINYFSIIVTFYIDGDTLYVGEPVSFPFSTRNGIEDARMNDDKVSYSAYASPWELGQIGLMNKYLENEPPKEKFDFTQHGCIGVVYMQNSKLLGFFPMKECDTTKHIAPPVIKVENKKKSRPDLPNEFKKEIPVEKQSQPSCYKEAVAPYYNRMIAELELPIFFAALRKSCNLK